MPLPAPPIDNRRYQDLVDELVQRIPRHTPEWTNFNASDPGITIIQLFAHITESLLYRTNQIPERNRAKFLSLLGIKLNPAKAAKGLVGFANERGPLTETLIGRGSELLAGSMPFRTTTSLDALPVEAQLFIKRPLLDIPEETREYYQLLYASYNPNELNDFKLYESINVSDSDGINLSDSVDRAVWIALLAREADRGTGDDPWKAAREALAGRTLSIGIVPQTGFDGRSIGAGPSGSGGSSVLNYHVPNYAGPIERDSVGNPRPGYTQLKSRADFDPFVQPGIVELMLPPAAALATWSDLDPLESGVGDLPPAVDDAKVADRILTWVRVSASSASEASFSWIGINAALIRQFIHVSAERLADGDGTPNQRRQLGRQPVLAGSVKLQSFRGDAQHDWLEIEDILAADPEVPVFPQKLAGNALVDVYTVDPEAGLISFGDGHTGRRPREGETLYARYDYSEGVEGNVGKGAIKEGPLIPAGVKATNPVPSWGGADAETVASGEKQVPRVIQHRERLVTADDYRTIAWRTPGVSIGRIEVLPACHPDISPVVSGTTPGVVTLMALPLNDPLHPAAPRSDSRFIDALCNYLEPRRLVTTEIALRGAQYVGIWISVGIEIEASFQSAEVIDAVTARIKASLSPLPAPGILLPDLLTPLYAPETDPALRGWPLNKPVHARTLLAEVARTAGVVSVAEVLLAKGNGAVTEVVTMSGLELPEILGISVVLGDAIPIDAVRGDPGANGTGGSANDGTGGEGGGGGTPLLPVPVVAETC